MFFVAAYRLEIPSHYLRRSSLVKTSKPQSCGRTHIFDKLLFLYGIWFIVLPTWDRKLNFIAMNFFLFEPHLRSSVLHQHTSRLLVLDSPL